MTEERERQTQVTLSGRELAMRRRQAMARLGKAGASWMAAANKTAAMARAANRVVLSGSPAGNEATIALTPETKPARARREALSRMGKAALAPSLQSRGEARPVARPSEPRDAVSIAPAGDFDYSGPERNGPDGEMKIPAPAVTTSLPASNEGARRVSVAPTGRALAQARRAVLAKEGKAGLKRVAQAVKIAAAMPEQDWQAAINSGATGRQIAMQRRLVRSLTGKSAEESAAPSRPCGRMRPAVAKGEAPIKVEEGHTLSGQKVTGTMVERSKLVTGNEAGAARVITGTEYIGAEQYDKLGVSRPQPNPPKVSVAETPKGKSITGALVGRSPKVTGDEVGAARVLTGTPYVGVAKEAETPEKVVVTHTAGGRPVTGTYVGRSAKMTGDERGICAKVTGTEYLAAELVRQECAIEPPGSPAKVTVSTTLGGRPVSGAAVGRSPKVTGDEPGACRPITGSQYYNTRDFAELCPRPSERRPASVMSPPPHRQPAAATEETVFPKPLGDAGCEAACATAHPFGLDRRPLEQAEVAIIPAVAVTGDRPGAGGAVTTGDERGACLPITGTPYVGEDNMRANCSPSSPASGRYLARPQAAPEEDAAYGLAPRDFSIQTPAREAWRRRMTITGVQTEDQRITGPVSKASGLITGTPDFRSRAAASATSKTSIDEVQSAQTSAAHRLSGHGAYIPKITGDAWLPTSRVTGTEGASVLARNPSLRGEPRGKAVGAREFRDLERQPVPESKVTGSSGNTTRGAVVTLSGGARA
ncbi:MAG: CsoS2 family carboxysome shell protein [Rhodocyclaceae bacterium]|nr:CsoS2 family carboxysome shell protein [Rhodocyclaceae bacterium]